MSKPAGPDPNPRITEILTARAHGEKELETQLLIEMVSDTSLLSAAFGSLLSSLEAYLDVAAERRGVTRIDIIQELAAKKADEW